MTQRLCKCSITTKELRQTGHRQPKTTICSNISRCRRGKTRLFLKSSKNTIDRRTSFAILKPSTHHSGHAAGFIQVKCPEIPQQQHTKACILNHFAWNQEKLSSNFEFQTNTQRCSETYLQKRHYTCRGVEVHSGSAECRSCA